MTHGPTYGVRGIYRRQQAFVLAFATSMIFVGLTLLIYPGNDQTLVIAGVPPVLRTLDHAGYMVGGLLLVFGVLRPSARLEASGHILVSSLFVVAMWLVVTQALSFAQAVGGLGFVLPLAVGSTVRAYLLVTVTEVRQ